MLTGQWLCNIGIAINSTILSFKLQEGAAHQSAGLSIKSSIFSEKSSDVSCITDSVRFTPYKLNKPDEYSMTDIRLIGFPALYKILKVTADTVFR